MIYSGLTACVREQWVGVEFVWEREKPEARKMLENSTTFNTVAACSVKHYLQLKKVEPLPETTLAPQQMKHGHKAVLPTLNLE